MGFNDERPEKAILYCDLMSTEQIVNYLFPNDHPFQSKI